MEEWHYNTERLQQMKDEWEKAKRERVNHELMRRAKTSRYNDWVDGEQLSRLKEDIERLLGEENVEKK